MAGNNWVTDLPPVAMRWVKVSHTHLEAMLPLSPCHTLPGWQAALADNGKCTGTSCAIPQEKQDNCVPMSCCRDEGQAGPL